jgi:hypothetical protein
MVVKCISAAVDGRGSQARLDCLLLFMYLGADERPGPVSPGGGKVGDTDCDTD